jgi:hypothetical protein
MNDGWWVWPFICFLVIVWLVLPDSWTNGVWYGAKYRVAFNQVKTSNKPSDCDWTRAPLGNVDWIKVTED